MAAPLVRTPESRVLQVGRQEKATDKWGNGSSNPQKVRVWHIQVSPKWRCFFQNTGDFFRMLRNAHIVSGVPGGGITQLAGIWFSTFFCSSYTSNQATLVTPRNCDLLRPAAFTTFPCFGTQEHVLAGSPSWESLWLKLSTLLFSMHLTVFRLVGCSEQGPQEEWRTLQASSL